MKNQISLLVKDFFNKPPLILKINWASVLFYLTFLCYGYFGSLTSQNFIYNIYGTIIIVFIQIVFGFIAWKHSQEYRDHLIIARRDVIIFFLFLLFFFIIGYQDLHFSLIGDELAYTKDAFRHSLVLSEIIINKTQVFDNIEFKYLMQMISLGSLLLLLALYYFTKKLSWPSITVIFVSFLVIFRVIIGYVGGNSSPHPPMNLFPLALSGPIIGLSDFSMKFSYFIGHTAFIYFYYRMLLRKFNSWQSILIALSIGTIPLLLRLGTTVEQSLWASLFFSFVLIDFVTSNRINFLRLITIGSIATMMRLPAFLVLIPIAILYFNRALIDTDKENNWKKAIHVILPTLFFLPFLLKQIIAGTPATIESTANIGIIEHFLLAIKTNIIWISTLNSIDYWWIPFLLFAFVPLTKATISKNVVFIIFFVSCLLIYYSIRPILWGDAKYQAEYVIPFIVVGYILFLLKLKNGKPYKRLIIIPLIFISINFIKYFKYPSGNLPVDELMDQQYILTKQLNSGMQGSVHFVYNYKDAYSYILKNNLANNSFSLGVNYGIIPEIFNGYTSENIRNVNLILDDYNESVNLIGSPMPSSKAEFIDQDNRIMTVLMGITFEKVALIRSLKEKNWKTAKEFKNNKYGSTIIVLKR